MDGGDLGIMKDIPGFKAILRAVLRSQMKHLVEQLSKHGDEESVVLTASISDGSCYHLGSDGAKSFFESRDEIKSQFVGHCMESVWKNVGADKSKGTAAAKSMDKVNGTVADMAMDKISPGTSRRSVTSTRQPSKSDISPDGLIKLGEKNVTESNVQQTVSTKVGASDSGQKRTRRGRKRPGETVTPVKVSKRSLAQTVTQILETLTPSGEIRQGVTMITSESIKEEADPCIQEDETEHKMTLPLELPATSESKDRTDKTNESNESDLPCSSLNDLTEIKVEPASDYDEDSEETTHQVDLDLPKTVTSDEGGEGSTETVKNSGDNTNEESIKDINRKTSRGNRVLEDLASEVLKDAASTNKERDVQDVVSLFACGICDKTYRSKKCLYRHKQRHLGKPRCLTCGCYFSNQEKLYRHTAEKHLQGFSCNICGKEFARRSQLKVHSLVHDSGKRRYVCSVDSCNKSFHQRTLYQDHLDMHSGIKSHECQNCPKKFSFRAALWSHTQLCMNITSNVCDQCGKNFSTQKSLKYHKKAKHSIEK